MGSVFVSGCSVNNSFVCKTRVTDKVANSKGDQLKNRSVVILQDFTYSYYRLPDYISKSMTEAFMANGYSVVERSNLESIFAEQKMSLSGAVKRDEIVDSEKKGNSSQNNVLDKVTIAKIGELTGANTILMVFAVPDGIDGLKNLNLRMVDVSTAEVIFTLNLINEGKDALPNAFINPLVEFVLSEHKKGSKVIYVYNIQFSKSGVFLNCMIDGKQKEVPLDDILMGIKKF